MKPYFDPRLINRLAKDVHYPLVCATFLICVWGGIASARVGLSRLFSEYGSAVSSLPATRRGVELNDADPAAHYAFAVELSDAGKNTEAVAELERAVSLKPDDYFLWQELGRVLEDNQDAPGAIRALQRAIQLAPHYSQPHWQLGNVLLREGEFSEGFNEMRIATSSDPTLLPVMADLAWAIYDSDVDHVLAAVRPVNDNERILLGRFFISQKNVDAGVNLILATSKVESETRKQIVKSLIEVREFQSAYRVWLKGITIPVQGDDLYDGGFEGGVDVDEEGFGWRPSRLQTVKVLLDPNGPKSGKNSLLIEFAGNVEPTVPIISQLMLVPATTDYRLNFAARSERLTSAGLPIVVVKEATGDRRVIAQSVSLPTGSQSWGTYSVDFKTAENITAITVSIERQPCSSNPCPIVGRAAFDDFSVKRLQQTNQQCDLRSDNARLQTPCISLTAINTP